MNARTRQEQFQAAATEYIATYGPADRATIAAWAYRNRRIVPDEMDIIQLIAEELSQAMCSETHIDPQGRRVRSKYAVRRRIRNEWGVWKQSYLWENFDTIDEESMHIHFADRRRQMVGHCQQVKNDMESFNENRNPNRPIQFDFDFNPDLLDAASPSTHPDFPEEGETEEGPV